MSWWHKNFDQAWRERLDVLRGSGSADTTRVLRVPAGQYMTRETIEIRDVKGPLLLDFAGATLTAAHSGPSIVICGSSEVVVRNLHLVGRGAEGLAICPSDLNGASGVTLHEARIHGSYQGAALRISGAQKVRVFGGLFTNLTGPHGVVIEKTTPSEARSTPDQRFALSAQGGHVLHAPVIRVLGSLPSVQALRIAGVHRVSVRDASLQARAGTTIAVDTSEHAITGLRITGLEIERAGHKYPEHTVVVKGQNRLTDCVLDVMRGVENEGFLFDGVAVHDSAIRWRTFAGLTLTNGAQIVRSALDSREGSYLQADKPAYYHSYYNGEPATPELPSDPSDKPPGKPPKR